MTSESPDWRESTALSPDDRNGAVFSPDRKYRYRLSRTWDAQGDTLAFIMLNPSTADETANDPTVTRCIGYAKDWGYGSLLVGNIFGARETDPSNLRDYDDPVGPENNTHLEEIHDTASKTIVAWGTHGALHDREDEVKQLLDGDLFALNITQDGHPAHPLYQRKDVTLDSWPAD